MLTILDEYTRECHVLRADRALKSGDVLEWMSRAIQQHGAPAFLRRDNGSEFIAKTVQKWLAENRIKTIYIEPGSPWQNGFVESFHGRLRDECLNREQCWTLTEARVVIEDYRREYNTFRPHSKLGYLSPRTLLGKEECTIPVSGRPTASLRRGWTNQHHQPTTQNNPQRLTLMWSNFPSPVIPHQHPVNYIRPKIVIQYHRPELHE
jgi:hypothetical protein